MVETVSGCSSRRERLLALKRHAPAIFPSMLQCNFGDLAGEVRTLEAAGAPALHLDVMDGHFVPNLTYGIPLVEAFHKLTSLPLDVHLMIGNPMEYVERYAKAGASGMTIHAEATDDARSVLRKIRQLDCAAGLAINPGTPVERAIELADDCDLILVMSVQPGFGGQAFDRSSLDKVRAVRKAVGDRIAIEIDGGIGQKTIADSAAAGVEFFVVGSAIMGTSNYAESMHTLQGLAASAAPKPRPIGC